MRVGGSVPVYVGHGAFIVPSAGKDRTMSYVKRSLEELNLMDDFLMGAVAADGRFGAEFCRIVLATFLGRRIGEVKVVAQRMIPAYTPKLRGIRMDVEVTEPLKNVKNDLPAMNIYDIEPHIQRNGDLEKRNRFYQAKIDGRSAVSGMDDFSGMPNLYVITITPYDPFGYNYMMYTVRNRCKEVPDMVYEDGLQFIYLNPMGTKGGTEEIREMLRYFQDSREKNATNATLKKVHEYVSKVKVLPEVEKEYMKFEEIIYYERKEAAEEAAERVEKEVKAEIKAEIKEKTLEDICDLLSDYGEVPTDLKKQLEQENDPEILRKWLKLSARVNSIEEFKSCMNNR